VAGRRRNPTRIDVGAGSFRRRRRVTLVLAGAALAPSLAVGVAACGRGAAGAQQRGPANLPAPAASKFPPVRGRNLDEIVTASGAQRANLVVSPSESVYEPGSNRFGFAVYTVSRSQVPDARVALYAAPTAGGPAVGPFPARFESLQVKPQFESQTTKRDPDAATSLYVSNVRFAHDGRWSVIALFRQRGSYSAAIVPPTVRVGGETGIPGVGERPPPIHTPTVADVNGNLSKIDTRDPPDDMHRVDFANALGKRPMVLLFATPGLCRSHVCGPVVDLTQEVEREIGGDAAFIHQEVYRHNNASDGVRPQLRAFDLRTEPWLFVIDRHGVITTRIEGPFNAAELKRAVRRAGG
jgi:hypothetical protein